MEIELPNKELHNFIIENLENNKNLPLNIELIKLENINSEICYLYFFKNDKSNRVIIIYIYFPCFTVFFQLSNEKKSFDLISYLHYLNRDYELKNYFNQYLRSKESEEVVKYTRLDCAKDSILLFVKYLETDLLEVAKGDKWLEIPSYMEGYYD